MLWIGQGIKRSIVEVSWFLMDEMDGFKTLIATETILALLKTKNSIGIKNMDKKFTSEDFRHHISLFQDSINRMASNSSNCKTWCIGIVGAILAFMATYPALSQSIWVASFIALPFLFLDAYYLGLEKRFRYQEKKIVLEYKSTGNVEEYIYNLGPSCEHKVRSFVQGLLSPSTWPTYLIVIILVVVIQIIIK